MVFQVVMDVADSSNAAFAGNFTLKNWFSYTLFDETANISIKWLFHPDCNIMSYLFHSGMKTIISSKKKIPKTDSNCFVCFFSIFFVKRNLDYLCKESNQCVVDVSRRNQCQACRFRRCLEVNMKRDGIGGRQAKSTTSFTLSEYSFQVKQSKVRLYF